MAKSFNLFITAGTIVFRNVNGQSRRIAIAADCQIDKANRSGNGDFIYRLGKFEYCASAGTVDFSENPPA